MAATPARSRTRSTSLLCSTSNGPAALSSAASAATHAARAGSLSTRTFTRSPRAMPRPSYGVGLRGVNSGRPSPGRCYPHAMPVGTKRPSTAQRKRASRPTTHKWVYLFEEGNASMRDLLGGKGAGVAEMTRAGLPVPPGFTITTEACNAFYDSGQKFPDGMCEQVLRALKETERKTGKKFGDPRNPLLVSV